jgi:hypothetical protein
MLARKDTPERPSREFLAWTAKMAAMIAIFWPIEIPIAGPDERDVAAATRSHAPDMRDLTGSDPRTAVLTLAAATVANDSGLLNALGLRNHGLTPR